jgi:4-azaleucine resistance transporter AzlC
LTQVTVRPPELPAAPGEVVASRRRLLLDGLGIVASVVGFGLVYGLSTRSAGFSIVEAAAMSVIVFAGASQFAAVGYVVSGLPWPGVVLLTAFINARHLLYSAALAPFVGSRRLPVRAAAAHVLTDESFALSIAHFRRVGGVDMRGYWLAGVVCVFVPWNVATIVGAAVGSAIPDPSRLGLDVIFPAAMAGLALGLVTGRRDAAAAVAAAIVAVAVSLASDAAAGVIAGGLLGPAVAMLLPLGPPERGVDADSAEIVESASVEPPS